MSSNYGLQSLLIYSLLQALSDLLIVFHSVGFQTVNTSILSQSRKNLAYAFGCDRKFSSV